MSISMPPSRQAGFAFRNALANPDREGRRGEERGDDDAKATGKRDSPARKRSISGSGDDAE